MSAFDLPPVDQRAAEPRLQFPPPESTRGPVDRVEERLPAAGMSGVEQFEAAHRVGVEAERAPQVVPPDARDVRERAVVALRVLRVRQERADGAAFGRRVEDGRRFRDVRRQRPVGLVEVERRRLVLGHHRLEPERRGVDVGPGRDEEFRRREAFEFVPDPILARARHLTLAGRDVERREGGRRAVVSVVTSVTCVFADERAEIRRARAVEQFVVDDGPRRDDVRHRAVDQSRRLLGVFDLVGDRDAEVRVEQRLEVRRRVIDRNTRHRVGPRGILPLGEGDLADAGDRLGGLAERLVEVAHLEEHERVRVGLTELEVLREHRGEFLASRDHLLGRPLGTWLRLGVRGVGRLRIGGCGTVGVDI